MSILQNPSGKQQQQEYQSLSGQVRPKPPVVTNTLRAFWVGGLIALLGQALFAYFRTLGLPEAAAGGRMAIVLVFLGVLLTGLGVYDELARYGGAGAAIPITGFANSVAAAAMEFRREGFVFGVGARIFTIAGPVILYGMLAAMAAGLLRWAIVGR